MVAIPWRKIFLVFQAAIYLQIAWFLVSITSFSILRRTLYWFVKLPLPDFSSIKEISWAVNGLSWRLPWTNTCLIRAAAVFMLLGQSGKIKIGVKKNDEFLAHAWIEDKNGNVIFEDRSDLNEFEELVDVVQCNTKTQADHWRQLLHFVREVYAALPREFSLVCVLMFLLAALEGLGLFLFLPTLEALGVKGGSETTGWMLQITGNVFEVLSLEPTLSLLLISYVLLISVYSLIGYYERSLSGRLEAHYISTKRKEIYQKLLQADWLFFVQERSSSLLHALSAALDEVGIAIRNLLELLTGSLLLLVYFFFALQLSIPITLVTALLGVFLLFVHRKRVSDGREIADRFVCSMEKFYSYVSDSLAAMKGIKAYHEHEHAYKQFQKQVDEISKCSVDAVKNAASLSSTFSTASALLLAFTLYLASSYFSLPLSSLLLFIFIFSRALPKLSALQQKYQYAAEVLPAYALVNSLVGRAEQAGEVVSERSGDIQFKQELKVQKISFCYQKEHPVLSDLEFHIVPGEWAGITGPSGVGKTTLADIIAGLLRPKSGDIFVDGTVLDETNQVSWKRQLSYVSQEGVFLHNTIRENLLFGSVQASELDIERVLREVELERLIASLPEGLDTTIADRGIRLSGGERQRLSLARALLRHPTLLILDEATSAVDIDTEKQILKTLRRQYPSLSVLLFTHRLSPLHYVERVYVLKAGKLFPYPAFDTTERSSISS